MDNASRYEGYSAFNLCSTSSVDLILDEAKKIKEPNYAGDLKLIKITRKRTPSQQDFSDYALVVVVDDIDKKIMVSDFVYSSKGAPLGLLQSTKDSFLFTFENPAWENKEVELRVHGGEYHSDISMSFLMGTYIGENKGVENDDVVSRYEFIAFSDYEDETKYSIVNKKYIESNEWFRTYKERADGRLNLHRTFPNILKKHKVTRKWN